MDARSASVSIPGVEGCLVGRSSPDGGVPALLPAMGPVVGLPTCGEGSLRWDGAKTWWMSGDEVMVCLIELDLALRKGF